jgi:hypothetical protein
MVLTDFSLWTDVPIGGIFIIVAGGATMILILWLVYRQMLANAKGCPECGYKMGISQKRFLLRISAFLGTIIILLIVGLLISTS